MQTHWPRRHELGLYLLLAFSISWAAWPLVALNPQSSPLVPFGPLIAAVTVSLISGGVRALRGLVAQLGRWRRPTRWYAIALLGPAAVTVTAAALSVAFGARPEGPALPDWSVIAASFATTLVVVGLFEELGWRGYALPLLQRRLDPLAAAVRLGLIWGLWHLPELLSDPDGQRPVAPFLVFVLAQSITLTWLYNSTQAALPIVMITHAATNTAALLVLPHFVAADYHLTWWLYAGLWAVAATVVAALTRSQLGRRPAKRAGSPDHRAGLARGARLPNVDLTQRER
jgi:uncharacterized protein